MTSDPIKSPFQMTEQERNDLLSELVKNNASCTEIAMRTGFITLQEEGLKKCGCSSCKNENLQLFNKRMNEAFRVTHS